MKHHSCVSGSRDWKIMNNGKLRDSVGDYGVGVGCF